MKLFLQHHPVPPKVIAAHEKFGWTSPSRRKMQANALRRQKARNLRQKCIAGLRVLMYVAMADGVVSVEEANVVASYLEARLALLNVEHDPEVTEHLFASAARLTVTPRSLKTAVGAIAKDRDYFTLVLDCALGLVEVEGDVNALALHVLETLAAAGTAAGWLAPGEAAARLTNLCLGSEWALRA
jgi:hypothetical protein